MDISAPVTDYLSDSLLTTKGDIIKRSATVTERFGVGAAGKLLAVNSAGDNLEYGEPSLPLTTKGDIFKRGASAVERLGIGTAGQILRVNSVPDDIVYDKPGQYMFDTEWTLKNTNQITLTTANTTILALSYGYLPVNTRFWINIYTELNKDANIGTIWTRLFKYSGTGTVIYYHDKTQVQDRKDLVANETMMVFLSCLMKVTVAGTIVSRYDGHTSAGEATVLINHAQMCANQLT